jgi:hypothetical protein
MYNYRKNCRYYTVRLLLPATRQMIRRYNYFETYYVDPCPLVPMDIGVTEKRQLYYYMANWTRVHHYLPTTVHHALTTTVTHTRHCAIFTLTDTRLTLQHQLGGANLRTIVSTLTHLYACPYVDHFNGSYDVICPLLDHSHCHNVTITLMYQDYGAYRWDGVMINTTIYSTQLCSNRVHLPYKHSAHSSYKYTWWYRADNTSWQWIVDRTPATTMSANSVHATEKCFKHPSHTISLFGDSHLYAILCYWTRTIRNRKSLTGLTSISYMLSDKEIPGYSNWSILQSRCNSHKAMHYGYLMTELKHWLASYVKRNTTYFKLNATRNLTFEQKQKSSILVLSFGTWDVAFRNITQLVQYGMPAFSQWLHDIRPELDSGRVRVIIFTPPAQGENLNFSNPLQPTNRTDLRNNALVASVVSLIRDAVRDKATGNKTVLPNVHIVDYFAMTFARRGESVDGIHYIALKRLQEMFNSDIKSIALGFVAERYLRHEICRNILVSSTRHR